MSYLWQQANREEEMRLEDIKPIAEKYRKIFQPYCSRVAIAGSIRREKSECKDIELVVIPNTYHLEEYFIDNRSKWNIQKNGGKYKQIKLIESVNLDLFICTSKTWAMNYFIRTGSAKFVHDFMIKIQKKGFCSRDAQLRELLPDTGGEGIGEIIPLKEEIDIFNNIGMKWVEPKDREK